MPPDVQEEPGMALYVHFPWAPPIVLASAGVKADLLQQRAAQHWMGTA